jgi:hypothetical protein
MNAESLEQIAAEYRLYKEPGLNLTRVTLSDILPKIGALKGRNDISVIQAGISIEGRKIFRIKTGSGTIKVLLWSQMHGDESTATKAIFDLINFFTTEHSHAASAKKLLNKLEIHFIPMLNPDGAEKFTRENSLNIDLNRDAVNLQCPEARLLKKIEEELKPEFCFNLHDQERYYSAARTGLTPAISFLAPPIDYDDTVNSAREKAMQLIVFLKNILDKHIPGRIAKYSDDHEPRSFGDNFNRLGSSTVLIESGFIPGDSNKEKIREYNFIALLSAFNSIATGSYTLASTDSYYDIPENERRVFDLMIKGASLRREGKDYIVDIGVNRVDSFDSDLQVFYSKGIIKEVGDLSTFTAHEVIDCTGLLISEGRVSEEVFNSAGCIEELHLEHLYRQGVTTISCKDCSVMQEYIKKPFNVILRNNIKRHEIKTEMPANFYLSNENGVRYLIVNGFPITFSFNKNLIRNGLIFR